MSGPLQYLLDTNILSETRKKQANEQVISFLSAAEPSSLYISVLTLGELRKGVALKKQSDAEREGRHGNHGEHLGFTQLSQRELQVLYQAQGASAAFDYGL